MSMKLCQVFIAFGAVKVNRSIHGGIIKQGGKAAVLILHIFCGKHHIFSNFIEMAIISAHRTDNALAGMQIFVPVCSNDRRIRHSSVILHSTNRIKFCKLFCIR